MKLEDQINKSIPEDQNTNILISHNSASSKFTRFNDKVFIGLTHSKHEYDRTVEFSVPLNAAALVRIRRELNEMKSEMEVHEESRHMTRFYDDILLQ